MTPDNDIPRKRSGRGGQPRRPIAPRRLTALAMTLGDLCHSPCNRFVTCLLFLAIHALSTDLVWSAAIDVPVIFTQLPRQQELETRPDHSGGTPSCDYGAGGRIVRWDLDGQLRVLTDGFDSACGADVSFDGQRIVFAAKRHANEAWNIWEMHADGSGVRQITREAGNCRSPAYLATLYTLVSTEPSFQIVFVSDAGATLNEYGGGATSLYSCRLDGSGLRRLTFNLNDDLDPFLMDDGRILFASWQRIDAQRGFGGRVVLSGVNQDGTDYALYCGDQGRRIKHAPCVTADGLVVFVEADEAAWDGAGQLACVTTRRNFHSYRAITHEEQFLYHSPSPLPDSRVLVSRRSAGGSTTYGLYRLDPRTGGGEPVFDDPGRHDLHARALVARRQPDGRSSSVNEQETTGKLYCLNAYLTDPSIRPYMSPGSIRRLRVLEGVPLRAGGVSAYLPEGPRIGVSGTGSTRSGFSTLVQRRIVGDFTVEEDGSFHIQIPANLPVQLQTVDENGMALRSCGWIWVKPHEARGCNGCHEDPERTPENQLVLAIQKPAVNLILPAEKRRTVDFRHDLQPIIDRKCVRCHKGDSGPLNLRGEMIAGFSQAYVSLLTAETRTSSEYAWSRRLGEEGEGENAESSTLPQLLPHGKRGVAESASGVGTYVHPGEARTSPLIWRLYGRNMSRPWDTSHTLRQTAEPCPPVGAEPLTSDERTAFVEWIDLGALWGGIPGNQDQR